MSLALTDDQRELKRAARDFLERECPIAYARAMMEDPAGYRPETWRAMADLGWLALAVPEAAGGLGLGLAELAVVAEEMGRVVLPGPFASSAIFATALIAATADTGSRDETGAARTLLAEMAAGRRVAAVVIDAGNGGDATRLEVVSDGYAFAVTGESMVVTDAHVADVLLVVGRTGDGQTVAVVERDAPGVTVTPQVSFDQTRKICSVRLGSAPASAVLGELGSAAGAVDAALDWARVALCAEAIGAAGRALELSVAYAKERVQFDRPIGSFQAVQHLLADMLRRLEPARAATAQAARAVTAGARDARRWCLAAKAAAGEACVDVVSNGIQVHGGIGYTWEHDLHLYYRRARVNAALLGDPAWCRNRLADLVFGESRTSV